MQPDAIYIGWKHFAIKILVLKLGIDVIETKKPSTAVSDRPSNQIKVVWCLYINLVLNSNQPFELINECIGYDC